MSDSANPLQSAQDIIVLQYQLTRAYELIQKTFGLGEIYGSQLCDLHAIAKNAYTGEYKLDIDEQLILLLDDSKIAIGQKLCLIWEIIDLITLIRDEIACYHDGEKINLFAKWRFEDKFAAKLITIRDM
jgi:hypothetical protein